MEDLKSKLLELETRPPPGRLDERVLAVLEAASAAPRVRIAWAVAAAALMGAVGFWAGVSWGGGDDESRRPPPRRVDSPGSKTIQVLVESSPADNPFDFSVPLDDGTTGEWRAEIVLKKDPPEAGSSRK